MRKLILKYLFLFYKYFDKGSNKSVAFERSIMTFIFQLFLNVYALVIYLGVADLYFSFEDNTPRWKKYFFVFFIITTAFLMIRKIFTKEEVLKVEMNKATIRKGHLLVFAYFLISLFILIILIKNK